MKDQLPIKQIFNKGIELTFARHKELIRLGWPFVLLILASSFVPEEIDGLAFSIAYAALFCITGVLGIVGCHRVFLLPKDTVSETPPVRWGDREMNFLLCMFCIGILTGIISIPLFFAIFEMADLQRLIENSNGVLSGLVFTIFCMPAYYFVARWSLILPDAAVDNDRTLSWAWDISSGHSFRLFIIIGALPLTTSFLLEFVMSFLSHSSFLSVIQDAIWLIVAVIEISFLSLAYEWIVSKDGQANTLSGHSK